MSNTIESLDAEQLKRPNTAPSFHEAVPPSVSEEVAKQVLGEKVAGLVLGSVVPAPGNLNTAAEAATEIIKANIERTTTEIQLKPIDLIGHTLKEAGVTDSAIQELAKLKSLKIDGILDKAGYKAVDEARKKCVKMRGIIKAKCEEGRAPLIEMQGMWIEKQKHFTALVEEIERPLKERQKVIDDALEEIKRKAEAEERERINLRVKELFEAGHILSYEVCAVMSPAEYIEALEAARQKKAEADRIKAEEDAAKAKARQDAIDEAERMRKEREDFEREKAEFEAEKAKMLKEANIPVPIDVRGDGSQVIQINGVDNSTDPPTLLVTEIYNAPQPQVESNLSAPTIRINNHQEGDDLTATINYIRQLNAIPIPAVLSRRGQRSVSNVVCVLKDMEENLVKNWESL